MTVVIRPVALVDRFAVQQILRTERHLWPNAGSKMWYQYWHHRRRNQYAIVAEIEGQVVGFAHWAMQLDRTRSIADLMVAKAFRRQGIGRQLLDYIGTPAQMRKSEALGFFLKMGFSLNGNLQRPRETTVVPKLGEAWILTYTGKRVNPLDLKPEDICIEDIAHALACINRFNGHAGKPVSVAQHSVYVSRLSLPGNELEGLLHDAAEAYLGDVTKWLKASASMAGYREAEDRAQRTIFDRFGVFGPVELSPSVQRADKLMVRFEMVQSFGVAWQPFDGYPDVTAEERLEVGPWVPWSWREAEKKFLVRFGIVVK